MKKRKTMEYLDWNDVSYELGQIQGTHDIFYDFKGTDTHFYKWCDKKNYDYQRENSINNQNKWFKEYKTDPEGEVTQPERCDYVEFSKSDFSRGYKLSFNRNMLSNKNPAWVNELIKLVCDNYEHLFEENDVVIYEEK